MKILSIVWLSKIDRFIKFGKGENMRRRLLALLAVIGMVTGMFGRCSVVGLAVAETEVLSHIEVVYTGDVLTTGGYVDASDFQVNAYYRDGKKSIGRIIRVAVVEDFDILQYTLTSGANTITVSYTEKDITVVGRCTVPVSESAPGWIYNKEEKQWTYRLGIDLMAAKQWVLAKGNWYYLDENGYMLTDWQEIDGKWYYLQEDGSCAINTLTPDGYRVDKDGVWIQ